MILNSVKGTTVLVFLFFSLSNQFLNAQCAANSVTTTFASNNGQDGNIFDIVPLNDIEIFCFDAHFNPGTINYEIYYRLGTSVGFQSNPGAWFLAGSGTVASGGNGNPTPLTLSAPIQVCAGSTVGFYITNTGGAVPNIRYTNGTAIGAVFSADVNLQVLEGYGKSYPFANTYSPRVWNGTVRYNTIVLCTPLPIELLDFDVTAVGDAALIEWSTASELNNDFFTVEKTKDGKNWVSVGQVDGAGNSIIPIDYSLIDENPYNGVSYYRLKQTDFDGKFDYSDVKSIKFLNANITELNLYPNPVKTDLFVDYKNISKFNFVLQNGLGKNVLQNVSFVNVSDSRIKVDISNLAPGVYFFRLNGESKKFVITD